MRRNSISKGPNLVVLLRVASATDRSVEQLIQAKISEWYNCNFGVVKLDVVFLVNGSAVSPISERELCCRFKPSEDGWCIEVEMEDEKEETCVEEVNRAFLAREGGSAEGAAVGILAVLVLRSSSAPCIVPVFAPSSPC